MKNKIGKQDIWIALVGIVGLFSFGVLNFAMAGTCASERRMAEMEAARRAIEEENRRIAAFHNLRQQFWLQALEMENRLVAQKARVLVDRELVTHAALDATLNTLDQLWQRWTHEPPTQTDKAWQDTLQENLMKGLAAQGILAPPEQLQALLDKELSKFADIAQGWQKEYSALESLKTQAQKVRQEAAAAKKEGVKIEKGQATAEKSAQKEKEKEERAKAVEKKSEEMKKALEGP